MILVFGTPVDSVTELVCARLAHCGYPYRLLDQARFARDYTLHAAWQGGRLEGYFAGPGWRTDFRELTAVYPRFSADATCPDNAHPDSTPRLPAALERNLRCEAEIGLVALLEQLPCTVVNRVRGGMSNNSKPTQALLLQQCGLRVPDTLVTDDPAAANAFLHEHGGEVIYKSLSGVRSIVRRVSPAQVDRLHLLRHGPAQFQQMVPGTNVRVHVVGEQLFVTRVDCDAVDYRYARHDGLDCSLAPGVISPAVETACLLAARRLDLLLAGIDLKITPDGEVFCFEVNPLPAFSYYELSTGQPISLALAELLHRGLPRAAACAQPPTAHALQPVLA